jgi:alpha-mannosidase
MNALAGRLHAVKMNTGGSREKRNWEIGTGVPLEVQHRITCVNPQILRILAELGFALVLDGAEKGKYTTEIEAALVILEKSLDSNGVLPASVCHAAEEALLPIKKFAKEYIVLLAGHAHIDMIWMWGWQETVQSTLATFRTVLAMMDEYPEFTFSQSQVSCYQLVEKFDPELNTKTQLALRYSRIKSAASK